MWIFKFSPPTPIYCIITQTNNIYWIQLNVSLHWPFFHPSAPPKVEKSGAWYGEVVGLGPTGEGSGVTI